jgi:hypothetical protein
MRWTMDCETKRDNEGDIREMHFRFDPSISHVFGLWLL